jgi:hypothetical protein
VRRVDEYRAALRSVPGPDWAGYLSEHSHLPGPRGNIELAQAVAEEADPAQLDALIATDDEYLVFCGVVGLGRVLASTGGDALERRLRRHASDERWRVREAVAMALQRVGESDLPRLLGIVADWAGDEDPLVLRAAAAGICEPWLLQTPHAAAAAISVCDRATKALTALPSDRRRDPGVRALRKGLGYCWSVAVAADPGRGLPRFQALSECPDSDVAWIVRENRRKSRLATLL